MIPWGKMVLFFLKKMHPDEQPEQNWSPNIYIYLICQTFVLGNTSFSDKIYTLILDAIIGYILSTKKLMSLFFKSNIFQFNIRKFTCC